ncbi:GNAT family N-acetyltransferase [Christiangramia aestuarii]|uniref:GNAT family N-acetyltransferase n=1 Tax=Christiangramia aestuarii TaxID=1028746 RepID=A0A7K1LP37_9FLAO|nr:GNAT family N-acetyltransferase [Christiangramia aestuarii]
MRILDKNELTPADKLAVLNLWNNEYPINLRYHDVKEFENYLQALEDKSHALLLDDNDRVLGWYFDFIRDKKRWFAAILDSEIQGKGYGSKLIKRAMKSRKELHGWVIDSDAYLKNNGQAYRSPLSFYKKLGFKIDASVRLETSRLSAVKIFWTL